MVEPILSLAQIGSGPHKMFLLFDFLEQLTISASLKSPPQGGVTMENRCQRYVSLWTSEVHEAGQQLFRHPNASALLLPLLSLK